ncbi:hypothetical protein NG791_25695 [Laspinema sp. D1]|uniref:NACHT and WD repeat domain-containing protein n=1 Tax=Laspinema palackyanum TaxID=3231601 RepID=UPI0034798AAD|nr:hypothetical protein [Laspinema sp. D2b]
MDETLSNSTDKKIEIDSEIIKESLIAQAERDIFQHSVVTFNHTEIIRSSREDIKSRKFIEASPYKGLKRFDTEDKDLFFGRDEFLTGLVNELEQTNLILLLGASGSGKSSVVRAGLIPWLSKKWGSHFVKLVLTPDRDPFESFYASLLSQYKQGDAQIAREAKADTLTEVISKLKKPDEYWFILLDQFEEIFTTSLSDKRNLFIKSLVQLDKTQQNSVKVIATMRADFLDKLSPYPKLVKATDQHRPLIAEMQADELRLAIEQPAAHHGAIFEPELVTEILNDIKGQAGYLPLLQYTLNLLWETEVEQGLSQDRTLNLDIYHQKGGVQGALQKHVDTIYEALSPDEQRATQKIFLKLVDIGEDPASGGQWKPVRRRASKALFEDKLEQEVLGKLIDQKLLVSDRSLDSQESTIDIAHEILLTSWTTLNTWIQNNRKAIAIRNRLNHDLNLWKSQKSDAELWSGSKLEQVLELRLDPIFNQVLGGFSPEENQFIDLSRGLRDRQRRRTVMALSSFSAFALMLAGLAGWQWRSAELSKIEISRRHSLSLLTQGQNFDALIEILRAATPFHNSLWKPHISLQGTLIDAVYAKKEYQRLEEHESGVKSITFSPDGKTLASGSLDTTIKLWDVETGKEIQTLTGHDGAVYSIAFSPDGKTLASVSLDNTIKLWDVKKGAEIQTFPGHEFGVYSIAFSPDGQTFASGSEDNTIKLWDVKNGAEIQTLPGHDSWVSSIAFSPDGQTLASGSEDNTIKLWNVKNGAEIQILPGHKFGVSSIAFSSDGRTLASGSWDNTIKLWDVKNGTEIQTLTGHDSWVSSIAFDPDGTTLASGGNDNTIKLWNVKNGTEIQTLTGHKFGISSIAFSPDGKTLASGSDDNIIKLWDVKKRAEIQALTGHESWVSSIAFSPDGQTLASGSLDRTIKLWNIETGIKIYTLTESQNMVTRLAFSPDGTTLASSSENQTIKLWNVEAGVEIYTLNKHQGMVKSIAFSPNSKTLASGSEDCTIKFWNVETGEEIKTLTGHLKGVNSIAFSPDGQTLASNSSDKTIKFWNVETGKEIQTLTEHQYWPISIAFSPDHKTLASVSEDRTINLWDVEKGAKIHTLTRHQNIWSIAFSSDGKILASGSRDTTIKLWDVETGKEIHTLTGHLKAVRLIAFSPDGQTLASVSEDLIIKLWDVEKGAEIQTLTGHQKQFRLIAFSPQENTLALISRETIHIWNINFDDLLRRGCNQVHSYLKTSPHVSEGDRKMCDGIATNK